jgi:hypothetical protein
LGAEGPPPGASFLVLIGHKVNLVVGSRQFNGKTNILTGKHEDRKYMRGKNFFEFILRSFLFSCFHVFLLKKLGN